MRRKYTWLKTILGFVIAIILIVAIPLLINECYKVEAGYITKWSAADALAYYGAILGSGATIVALVLTISFTRKQIRRDNYLNRQQEKWGKIDNIITKALIDIHPLNIHKITMELALDGNVQPIVLNLQKYAVVAKTSIDAIKLYANVDDYRKMETLITQISSAIKYYCDIEQEYETLYKELQQMQLNSRLTNMNIPQADIDEVFKKINQTSQKLLLAHNDTYQSLLNLKRQTFDKILSDINAEAEQLLMFSQK